VNQRTVRLQLLVFGIIAIVIVTYTLFDLLGVRVTNRPFHVTVHLRTGGGIFADAEVAYRGVQVGTVSAVDLGTSEVTLTLEIENGRSIPANAIAHVYDLSAVGEQYVDLVPTKASTQYLHDGSIIPVEHTSTPLQTATVLYDLQRFVSSIDPHDVQILANEGAQAFAGTGPQLKSLLADTATIIAALTSTQDSTGRLLRNSATLLDTAAAHVGDFDRFAASLAALSRTLAASTPTLDKFLEQAGPTAALFDKLIVDNGSAIGVLLGNLATISGIQVARLPGLKALLVAVPEFGSLTARTVDGGALRGVLNFNADQAVCPSGVPLTNPLAAHRSALRAADCTVLDLPRGAANAPRPGANSTRAAVGAYDAQSGLVTAGDATPARLGVTGGQQELMGDRSWQAMLLAVTGS
jgi:phospholipid/cholesterol/gamma-HCH transport system substrate-binding protein